MGEASTLASTATLLMRVVGGIGNSRPSTRWVLVNIGLSGGTVPTIVDGGGIEEAGFEAAAVLEGALKSRSVRAFVNAWATLS